MNGGRALKYHRRQNRFPYYEYECRILKELPPLYPKNCNPKGSESNLFIASMNSQLIQPLTIIYDSGCECFYVKNDPKFHQDTNFSFVYSLRFRGAVSIKPEIRNLGLRLMKILRGLKIHT